MRSKTVRSSCDSKPACHGIPFPAHGVAEHGVSRRSFKRRPSQMQEAIGSYVDGEQFPRLFVENSVHPASVVGGVVPIDGLFVGVACERLNDDQQPKRYSHGNVW